jgi:hypothetical protein
MVFKQVPVEALEIHKKYKFVYDHCKVYIFATLTSKEEILMFNKITYVIEGDIDSVSSYHHYMIYKSNLPRVKFYIPMNKELAQLAMEKRALDKILQKIIGDTHFEW